MMRPHSWVFRLFAVVVISSISAAPVAADSVSETHAATLGRSGDNREQISRALERVPADQRTGLEFLLRYMPEQDLRTLTADFLLENVDYAYRAWREAPWHDQIPEELFLNDVLPYANINERRDRWRKDFYQRFKPLIADTTEPGAAAAHLNQKLFPLVNVRYSTGRPKADQSPYESIEAGLASCTGLSILLIDACRAVGIPARFAGTPLWSDRSGNHSWVEVWDQKWHFTGAAEPSGDDLDKAWFVDRATTAQRDVPRHAIYAVSFRSTPLRFPLVWDRSIDYVRAVNVTDRYRNLGQPLPEGHTPIMVRVLNASTPDRCAANFRIRDRDGNVVYQGQTRDERFDTNDHVTVPLPKDQVFEIEVEHGDQVFRQQIDTSDPPPLVTLRLTAKDDSRASDGPVEELVRYLNVPLDERAAIADQPFARSPLSEEDARRTEALLWDDRIRYLRETRANEMQRRELRSGQWRLRFDYKVFGDKPPTGHSLFISMHGGGNAPTRVNDRQWENQKGLYELEEGIYLCPRAPSDTWDLWHRDHIDPLFERLIENFTALKGVDPNRVYLMGYSAGGDGVYQLAPRMADRLAAAAVMAGHPNETQPLGLRNLPFTLHMGENDGAYHRNEVAVQWGHQLDALKKADAKGYVHWVKIHAGMGHWMNHEDATAIPWMAQYDRQPFPEKIVWQQDDVIHRRFYWLALSERSARPRTNIIATRAAQRIDIQTDDVRNLTIRLHDAMLDLDQPIEIWANGQSAFHGVAHRTIAVQAATLAERSDPRSIYRAEIAVTCPGVPKPDEDRPPRR